MMVVNDTWFAAAAACLAGLGVAIVYPMQHQPAFMAPRPVIAPQPITETFVPFDPVTEQERLDAAQEKLETQSMRLRSIDRKLDLLLNQEKAHDAGPRPARRSTP